MILFKHDFCLLWGKGWGCFPMPPNIWECCWKDQSHLVTPPISLFLCPLFLSIPLTNRHHLLRFLVLRREKRSFLGPLLLLFLDMLATSSNLNSGFKQNTFFPILDINNSMAWQKSDCLWLNLLCGFCQIIWISRATYKTFVAPHKQRTNRCQNWKTQFWTCTYVGIHSCPNGCFYESCQIGKKCIIGLAWPNCECMGRPILFLGNIWNSLQ